MSDDSNKADYYANRIEEELIKLLNVYERTELMGGRIDDKGKRQFAALKRIKARFDSAKEAKATRH
jgi:hypothetical protein